MTIVYTAPPGDEGVFEKNCREKGHSVVRIENAAGFNRYSYADLWIDACFDSTFFPGEVPLLFHCPALTFSKLAHAPEGSGRFCAWPGFWERGLWEIALKEGSGNRIPALLEEAGIRSSVVADIPGLIGPRILCTIINEAIFTLNGNIASAADIDIAMKLGTNYPMGPLEWGRKAGAAEIRKVLEEMAGEDIRYTPAPDFDRLDKTFV